MLAHPVASLALSGLIALGPATAHAWDLPDDVVRIEVLDGGTTADGTVMAALHLTLADGWKTYWRAPGDAGIPPTFDWAGSENLDAVSMTWPTPDVFFQYGMRSIGYAGTLVLPIEITPATANAAIRVKGSVHLGVCEDVCIPSSVTFDQVLAPGSARNPVIAAALASRPYSADEAGVLSAVCHLSPAPGGQRIEAHIVMPPAGDHEHGVIEPGDPEVWASEPEMLREGNTLIVASQLVHVDKADYALDRSAVRITILGDRHAVDILGCAPA
jgi:DsbC/DsbD-like thiol-disulfide interchange protein